MRSNKSFGFKLRTLNFIEHFQDRLSQKSLDKIGPLSSENLFDWLLESSGEEALKEIPVTRSTIGVILADCSRRKVHSRVYPSRVCPPGSRQGQRVYTIYRADAPGSGAVNKLSTEVAEKEKGWRKRKLVDIDLLLIFLNRVFREHNLKRLGPLSSKELFEDLVSRGYEEAFAWLDLTKTSFAKLLNRCSKEPYWTGIEQVTDRTGRASYTIELQDLWRKYADRDIPTDDYGIPFLNLSKNIGRDIRFYRKRYEITSRKFTLIKK